jgi:hypothetical protein
MRYSLHLTSSKRVRIQFAYLLFPSSLCYLGIAPARPRMHQARVCGPGDLQSYTVEHIASHRPAAPLLSFFQYQRFLCLTMPLGYCNDDRSWIP